MFRRHVLRPPIVGACLASLAMASACGLDGGESGGSAPNGDDGGTVAPGDSGDNTPSEQDANAPDGGVEPSGPFFGAAYVEDKATLDLPSEGDLWPSCWSDDDAVYAANGDGHAFGNTATDIALSRITGSPFTSNLAGSTLATGAALGQIWTPGKYNRKPTGMLCIGGAIYLAVQDLSLDFLDVPAATIAVSTNHGSTWSWDTSKPMFSNYVMTTLMFLDFGKDSANAIDDNVYVYAIDDNWRFTTRRTSPTKLWLARVPKDKVLDRSAWTYFTGLDASGNPSFDPEIAKRTPVLEDAAKVYTKAYFSDNWRDMTVISQGGVVYDAPLKRYLYTSWTEYTFEFYEAPQPWGPWKKFLSRDYGSYPWTDALNGGYATTIPSKFISADGKTMFVQSNTFMGDVSNYSLSFRKLLVDPLRTTPPTNTKSEDNLALAGTPIFRGGHAGPTTSLNDGVTTDNVDSWTNEEKNEDFWGVVWARPYMVSSVSYTTGKMFSDGGWFTTLRLQVRKQGEWIDVPATTTPPYPMTDAAGTNQTYVFSFAETAADGVRVIGAPGGSLTFTSAAEITARYK